MVETRWRLGISFPFLTSFSDKKRKDRREMFEPFAFKSDRLRSVRLIEVMRLS